MHRPLLSIPSSGKQYFAHRQRRPPPHRDVAWSFAYEELIRNEQARQAMRDLDTAYARRQGTNAPWIGQGVPKAGHRTSRYLQFACGAGGNSYRRWQWNKSTAWEYWIPGCLSESSTRFRKYFRISRERFDMIYEAGPTRPGRHQDFKRIPLCLLMAASFRRVASGSVFSTHGEEFHISP